jgi:hypothetical protein
VADPSITVLLVRVVLGGFGLASADVVAEALPAAPGLRNGRLIDDADGTPKRPRPLLACGP